MSSDPHKQSASDNWLEIGYKQSSCKKLEAAVLSFGQVVSANPSNADGWTNRGGVLEELDRLEEAASNYADGLMWNPKSSALLIAHAGVLMNLERYNEAAQSYKKAILLVQGLADSVDTLEALQCCHCNATDQLNKLENTIQQCLEGLAENPANGHIWTGHGHALLALGRHDEAIKSFKVAIKLHGPTDPSRDIASDWIRLGRAFGVADNVDMALSSYQKAESIDNGNEEAVKGQILMARRLVGQGSHSAAVAAYCSLQHHVPAVHSGVDSMLRVIQSQRHLLWLKDHANSTNFAAGTSCLYANVYVQEFLPPQFQALCLAIGLCSGRWDGTGCHIELAIEQIAEASRVSGQEDGTDYTTLGTSPQRTYSTFALSYICTPLTDPMLGPYTQAGHPGVWANSVSARNLEPTSRGGISVLTHEQIMSAAHNFAQNGVLVIPSAVPGRLCEDMRMWVESIPNEDPKHPQVNAI